RPLQSVRILLGDRSWMLGFGMETVGFLLYATALALASLALVQSIAAGGIGVLAYVSARFARRRLSRREFNGVLISIVGLVVLGGVLGALRVLAFIAVTIGAVLLARPGKPSEDARSPGASDAVRVGLGSPAP